MKVKQIGIWAGSLEDSINTPLSLFGSAKQNVLQKTIDEIIHASQKGRALTAKQIVEEAYG